MRRLTALHALVVVVVMVTACGQAASAPTSVKHVDLAFAYDSSAINAMQEMAMGARAAAAEIPGVSLTTSAPPGAGFDTPAEVALFQAAMKSSRDGIALITGSPDAFLPSLQQARSLSIPVIAVDTPPPPSMGVGTFVGNSNYEVGRLLGNEMLKKIPAGATGQVVVGTSIPGFAVLDQRITGFLSVLRQQRPALQIVGPFNSHIVAQENLVAWRAEVAQYPNAVAYLAPSDLDAASLAQVQRETGRRLLVGGCDLEDAALQAIREGLVYALASPEHWLKGYIAISLLARRAQHGKALPNGWWNPGALVVNQSNVDDIIARQRDQASRSRWFAATVKDQLSNPAEYVKPLSAAT